MTLVAFRRAEASLFAQVARNPRSLERYDAAAAALSFLALLAVMAAHDWKSLGSFDYWTDWADQSKYLASAAALAKGDLTPAAHWYPLLYPLALAACCWLPVFFAAAAVNVACYTLAYIGFRQIAARFGLPRLHALALFLATTLTGDALQKSWLVPWTTTLSAALIWLAIAQVAALCEDRAAKAWAAGTLLALLPLCRPADAAVSAVLGPLALAGLWRQRRDLRAYASFFGAGAMALLGYGALHLAIYGAHATDYMKLSAAFGFDLPHFGWRAQTLLVYPGPFFPFSTGVCERYPWLFLAAAGFVLTLMRREGRFFALLVGLPALVYLTLMLAYSDLLPSNLWTFRLIHYFKWIMPAMGLFAYNFVTGFMTRKAVSLLTLGAVAATGCCQYEAVAAGPDEPARLLLFRYADSDFSQIYNAHSVIVDRAGVLRNLLDYHQVRDGRGEVFAIAWRRDFGGGESWRDSSPEVVWPNFDPKPVPHPALLEHSVLAPSARYRARFAFGVPCWISPRACRRDLPKDGGARED